MSFFTFSKILAVPLGNLRDYDSILEHVPLKDRKIFEVQIVQIGSSKGKVHLWCNEIRGIGYTLHIPGRVRSTSFSSWSSKISPPPPPPPLPKPPQAAASPQLQKSTFLGCWHAASQQRRHSWGQPEVEWIGIFSMALLSPIPNRPPSSKVNLTPKPPADVPLRTKCVASNKLKWWLRWFITFLTISTLIIDQWQLWP